VGGAEDEYTRVSMSICAARSAELDQAMGTAVAAAEAEAEAEAEAQAEAGSSVRSLICCRGVLRKKVQCRKCRVIYVENIQVMDCVRRRDWMGVSPFFFRAGCSPETT